MNSKVAFITGASSGIGLALAEEFLKQGYGVALMARRIERLNEFAERFSQYKNKILLCPGDVTQEEALKRSVNSVISRFGRLDVVVANAGIGVTDTFLKLTADDFKRQFATNVDGVVFTCRQTLPELLKTKGCLAIVGSASGYANVAGDSPYSMSKAAVRALADTLYLEQKKIGVHILHICPGFIKSEIRLKDNQDKLIAGAKDKIPSFIVMPASTAARKIVKAIRCRRRELVLTFVAKFAVFVRMKLPRLYFFLVSKF